MIGDVFHNVRVIDMRRSFFRESADILYIILSVKIDQLFDWILFGNWVDVLLWAYGVHKVLEKGIHVYQALQLTPEGLLEDFDSLGIISILKWFILQSAVHKLCVESGEREDLVEVKGVV